MKVIFFMLLLVFPYQSGTAQPCDIDKGFSEIEKLYNEGYFDQALDKTKIIEACTAFTEEQYRDLLILKYKCFRNIRKGGKSQATPKKLKDYMAAKNIPLDFEIQFLLAEVYALRGKKDEHSYYFRKIEDNIMSNPRTTPEILGRFYLGT